jgi:hypothetical protein
LKSLLTSFALLLHLANALSAQSSTHFDIPYVHGAGHKQQLDLFVPDRLDYSTILFVHEGSLSSGDRKDHPYMELCDAFRRSGIACAAMSYRLFPNVRWPAPVEDIAAHSVGSAETFEDGVEIRQTYICLVIAPVVSWPRWLLSIRRIWFRTC